MHAHPAEKKTTPPHDDLTLALNAAEGLLQIAFADTNGRFIYGQSIAAPSRGVEMLIPSVDHALRLLERKPKCISRIAAVVGPGSFTGLRLATTTAAGLARAVGASQAALEYMHLVARECLRRSVHDGSLLCCMTRARRDLVYGQCFTANGRAFSAATNLEVLSVSSGDAARYIARTAKACDTRKVILVGSGAQENRDPLLAYVAQSKDISLSFSDAGLPSLDTLVDAAFEARFTDEDIEPLYVRSSDAEQNLPQIAERLGLDPDQAVAQLRELTHLKPE